MSTTAELSWQLATFVKLLEPLRKLHRHRVEGLEKLPTEGGYLLATNHSFATYDAFLLGLAFFHHTGRHPTGLADDLLFKIPLLRDYARSLMLAPASPENGEALLREGHVIFLAPGGMREALRPPTERHQVRWQTRKGFVRLALRAQVPIVLAACPAADELFDTYPNKLTAWAYKTLKLPLMPVRGFGPTLLPRPLQLTHYVDDPIVPPPLAGESAGPEFETQVDELHAEAVARMQALMRREWS